MEPSRAMPFRIGLRVSLQPASLDDVPVIVKWANDPATRQLARNSFPRTLEAVKKQVEDNANVSQKSDLIWFIVWHNADARTIGEAKLTRITWANRNAALWVGIGDTDYWHQGLGREAGDLALGYAFDELNMHKIIVHVIIDHERAIAALEAAGFNREVTYREQVYFDYTYHDLAVYAMFEADWRAAHPVED
ncbi:MAG TPA: GNAT family protein [Candidatus Lokiarchaeia archaeon]|nr:GNAT family protein [Candidatus Lokiarchaeia archaeon]